MSAAADRRIDWSAARTRMALPAGKINLNAGTLSPTPWPVLDAVTRLREQMARDPSDFLWRKTGGLIERSRRRLAEYAGCRAADLLLLPNATFGINIIINSLRLPPDGQILTTDHEYGAMMYAWRRGAARRGWTLRPLALPDASEDPAEIVKAFAAAIDGRTVAIYFSHVTTSTGLVLPARELCALARERGLISILDGAHAPGMVPLELGQLGPDYYAANCHKWMMCPATAGFLHVAPPQQATLESLVTSWGWEYDRAHPEARSVIESTCWQFDHEFHGTVDRTPQMVIPEALDFRAQLGGDEAIRARVRELVSYAHDRLAGIGLQCVTPRNPALSGAMAAFEFPCDDLVLARDRLYHEHGIECPITSAGGRTFLRVSCAWFNTHDEIDRLARAVATLH